MKQLSTAKPLMTRGGIQRLAHGDRTGVVIALVAIMIYLWIASPFFLTKNNLTNIGTSIAVLGIVAVGSTIVMVGGGLDISIGSNVALAGVIAAKAISWGWGPWGAIATAVIAGGVAGMINGLLVARLGVNPLIATLGTLSIFRGLAFIVSDGVAVGVPEPMFVKIGTGRLVGIPNPFILLLVVLVLAAVFMRMTTVGRNLYALGGNPEAARLAGINTTCYKFGLYAASGALAGVSAVVLTARLGSAQPLAAAGLELDAIAACVLGGVALSGGVGTIGGTVLGVVVLGVVNNGLSIMQVDSFYQYLARGGVLVIAVVLDEFNARRRDRSIVGMARTAERRNSQPRLPLAPRPDESREREVASGIA
jgi:L-arabinose transport system permease protein